MDKFVDNLRSQLADKAVKLDGAKKIRKYLAINGYDPNNGADLWKELLTTDKENSCR